MDKLIIIIIIMIMMIMMVIMYDKEPMGPDENFWFLQDAGGGIWKVDLSFSLTMKKPQKIRQVGSRNHS